MKPIRWQDWVNVILGAWLIVAPWALDVASQMPAAGTIWLLGAAIAVFAGISVYMPKAWEEAVNILLGLCLVVSPWVMGFATETAPTVTAVVTGILVVAFGIWAMLQDADVRKWFDQRRQASGTH
jgi:small neutral amino acid transporter SnatA (MarC family)